MEEFRKNGVVLLRGVLNDWVPYLREVTEHQMAHPQVSAFLTGLRTFFSMDYVQAGLFLTNNRYLDFWMSSPVAELVADLKQAQEVRLIVDQLNVNPHCPMPYPQRRPECAAECFCFSRRMLVKVHRPREVSHRCGVLIRVACILLGFI